MKKLKIMLLSLALFAVVGGALAFKAKFLVNYCTTDIPGGGLTCADVNCPIFTNSTTLGASVFKCYTTPKPDVPNNQKCTNHCISSTTLRFN